MKSCLECQYYNRNWEIPGWNDLFTNGCEKENRRIKDVLIIQDWCPLKNK